jgi:hypothetical protein
MRQAPDGGKDGGTQPTESRVLPRRVFLAPALPRDHRKNSAANVNKLLPTLDIGSHIHARFQARREAGAQRTLYAVACTPLILIEAPSSAYPGGMLRVETITHE